MDVFDLYFCSVVSMQFHPGSGTRGHTALSLEECAQIALEMLILRNRLIEKGNLLCHGVQ